LPYQGDINSRSHNLRRQAIDLHGEVTQGTERVRDAGIRSSYAIAIQISVAVVGCVANVAEDWLLRLDILHRIIRVGAKVPDA
jgi:hypothetical protein